MRKLIALMALLIVAALAFWAGRVSLAPPETAEPVADRTVTAEVAEQEVGRVLTLTTTVSRSTVPLAVNHLQGVVTSVSTGGEVANGDMLYAVDGAPVWIIQSGTPFHRDLYAGLEGDDVRQVQKALVAGGADLPVTGKWRSGTTSAVKAWRKAAGLPQSGGLPLGSLIAAPELPITVQFDTDQLWEGAQLSGGEKLVFAASGEPRFVMQLTASQRQLIDPGTEVRVRSGDVVWTGVTGEALPTETGFEVPVTTAEGGVLCGDQCDALPAAAESNLLTDVLIIEPITGPVVPVSAVSTQPDGASVVVVVSDDGEDERRPVVVLTIADGLAVVEGVEAGERVRVLSDQ